MKLFYLADTIYSPAGMERVLITKANLLATRYGYDVTIVTNHQKGRPTFFPLDPHVKHIDLNVNTHLPWNMPRYMRRLKALVKAEKPDIVDSLCSKELTRLHELKGLCKVVMGEFHFSHDTYVIKGQLRKLRAYEKAVAELDCFVVLTREDEKAWAPYCSRLEQIYNPADGTPGERAPLEAKRCISGGRFEKQKNYDDMVRVWKIVRQRHPDWTLDLYGPKYLSNVLKQTLDVSPNSCIDQALLRQAKSLLSSTSLSIQQISDRLGFQNQSHFGTFFKRHVGCSPKEFRLKLADI